LRRESLEQPAGVCAGALLKLLQSFFARPWPVIESASLAHFHLEHLGQLHQGGEIEPWIFGIDPFE
jgi:hypothetical protein